MQNLSILVAFILALFLSACSQQGLSPWNSTATTPTAGAIENPEDFSSLLLQADQAQVIQTTYPAVAQINQPYEISFNYSFSGQTVYLGFAKTTDLNHPLDYNDAFQFIAFSQSGPTYPFSSPEAGEFSYFFGWLVNNELHLTPIMTTTFTAPSSSAIQVSLVPSRLSGVAPLLVQFDATDTTANSTTRPFHELEYDWDFDFGQPDSGEIWKISGKSKKYAKGPVAAHLFDEGFAENERVFTVHLTVRDHLGNSATQSVNITVTNPNHYFNGTNTICFRQNSGGSWNGCPAGAQQITESDYGAIMNDNSGNGPVYVQPGKRILLRRGDTWAYSGYNDINVAGPGTVGAFGPENDPRPVLQATGSDAYAFRLSGTTPLIEDWRIMDLEIDGQGSPNSRAVSIYYSIVRHVTLYNLYVHDVFGGVTGGDFTSTEPNNSSDFFGVVDSTFEHPSNPSTGGGIGMFLTGGDGFIFQGNSIDNRRADGQGNYGHVFRIGLIDRGVIQHNYFANAGYGKNTIKLHSFAANGDTGHWNADGTDVPSSHFIISDNKINASGGGWSTMLAPQNSTYHEIVEKVIIERNDFYSYGDSGTLLYLSALDVTVRNNRFNMDLVHGEGRGIYVNQRGPGSPTPENVHIFNNSFEGTVADYSFTGIEIGDAETTVVRNNLAQVPNATDAALVNDDSGILTLSSNNIGYFASNPSNCVDYQGNIGSAYCMDPLLESTNPENLLYLELQANSPAMNEGLVIPSVLSDFNESPRPLTGATDIGAFENE